jgi:hypothetical protein
MQDHQLTSHAETAFNVKTIDLSTEDRLNQLVRGHVTSHHLSSVTRARLLKDAIISFSLERIEVDTIRDAPQSIPDTIIDIRYDALKKPNRGLAV